MTILVAGGDSFIWGAELADCPEELTQYSINTFSALIAKEYGFEYSCAAWSANANAAIARMTMNECEKQRAIGKDVVVLVTWTFIDRFEFMFTYSTYSPIEPWCSINTYGNGKPGVARFQDIFYKHIGTNETYQQYNTLNSIILLQTYLQTNKIPYMFTTADNRAGSRFEHHLDESVVPLRNMIDWDKWFYFPPGELEDNKTKEPRGFAQWAWESGYKIAPRKHPLESAHIDAYLLMKEKFNELVERTV